MASRGRRGKERQRTGRIILIMWGAFAVITAVVLLVLHFTGISFTRQKAGMTPAQTQNPMTDEVVTADAGKEVMEWRDDWVMYDDAVYDLNEKITTYLVTGIDKQGDVVLEDPGAADGGQADFIFLVAVNPVRDRIDLIGINRNTMADIDVYDENGSYETTVKAQIAVQHGFGDGGKESCEYQKRAVSRLMCDLPIDGYISVNMSAIGLLNDAVGGVVVTPGKDFQSGDHFFHAGVPVELDSEAAFVYLRNRDVTQLESADDRLMRQKEYLTSFLAAVRERVKSDPMMAVNLFMTLQDQMVTDLSVKEISLLVTQTGGYGLGEDSFHMLEGTTVMGQSFPEFYPDEEALYRLIIDIFYEKVG